MRRRDWLLGVLGACLCRPAAALRGLGDTPAPLLDAAESRLFRAWMLAIIGAQLERGPTPRWTHRDCASLVRFAVRESLRRHDAAWRRANGMRDRRLPPELALDASRRAALRQWSDRQGQRQDSVPALTLIQMNSRFLGKELARAEPADLLFYDQGDAQHLMVWMGGHIAYHTGTETPSDNGLRAVSPRRLMQWEDTRWRPEPGNSNYIGVFRLAFLSA
jgi:uncharacterized protein YfaT (DUF1175 family)